VVFHKKVKNFSPGGSETPFKKSKKIWRGNKYLLKVDGWAMIY
jgi:hypothetical protein